MSRVLFLYATGNSGHQKAAEAVQKALLRLDPSVAAFGIDFFTYHYPTIGPFIYRMYVDLMQSAPHLWDYLYDSPDVASFTRELREFFALFNVPKIRQLFRRYSPDIIVCTQAVPASFVAAEKKRGKITAPLVAVITDFVANPYWPSANVDLYCVPHEEIKAQLAARRIPESRIKVTGIPVDASFSAAAERPSRAEKTGPDPEPPTVLIMGGSQGLGQIAPAVDLLSAARSPLQMIVVTGDNHSLYRQLSRRYAGKKNIQVLPMVKSVSRLMASSDLLISKPGGLTSSEALTRGLPMVILSPLPGQEERNASFLVRQGVAERCESVEMLPAIIEGMLRQSRVKRFRAQAGKLARPYAALDVAHAILGYA